MGTIKNPPEKIKLQSIYFLSLKEENLYILYSKNPKFWVQKCPLQRSSTVDTVSP